MANIRFRVNPARQARPMLGRMRVMLDMVAVVQKQEIVDSPIMAHGSARVFVMSMNPAKDKSRRISGEIS